MNDRSVELPHRLRSIAGAYPEDIFIPLTEAEQKAYSAIITRASAGMGRHLGKFMAEAADRIERLERLLETVEREWPEVPGENSGLLWQIRDALGMQPDPLPARGASE